MPAALPDDMEHLPFLIELKAFVRAKSCVKADSTSYNIRLNRLFDEIKNVVFDIRVYGKGL